MPNESPMLTFDAISPGSVDKQAVEVTNCFCVPHKEYEDHVEAELQYAQDMFELNKKVKHPQLLSRSSA